MHEDVLELKAACAAQPSPTASDLIRIGDIRWFNGRAASAPDGTIALSQRGDFKIVIREDDVLDVEKHDDGYLVKVAAEANVLVTLGKVVKAGLTGCGCSDTGAVVSSKEDGPRVDPKSDVNLLNVDNCVIRVECQTIAGHRVCFIVGVTCAPG